VIIVTMRMIAVSVTDSKWKVKTANTITGAYTNSGRPMRSNAIRSRFDSCFAHSNLSEFVTIVARPIKTTNRLKAATRENPHRLLADQLSHAFTSMSETNAGTAYEMASTGFT